MDLNVLSFYFAPRGICPLPKLITFEITHRCNLRCKKCFVWGDQKNSTKKLLKNEITLEHIKNILNELPNDTTIMLHGGEIFIRKDIMKIVRYIKKKGFYLHFSTNGTLINKKIAKEIIDLDVDSVAFSLDGDKKTNDKIRGEGVFDKVVKTIKLLQELKKESKKTKPYLFLNSVICEYNTNKLDKLVDVASLLNIGLKFSHLIFFDKSNVNADLLIKKIKLIKEKSKKLNVDLEIKQFDDVENIEKWYENKKINSLCLYPYTAIRIKPNGDVTPCWFVDYKYGNIKEKNFRDIWTTKSAKHFRNSIRKKLLPQCKRCCKLTVIKDNDKKHKILKKLRNYL